MPRFVVENFGCRASQADGAALEQSLRLCGYVRDGESPDVVVLNTCTVTAAADTEVRSAVRRVQREHPEARIVVTGCYAQRAPEEVASLPGVSLVVGNSHKASLAGLIDEQFATAAPFHGEVLLGEAALPRPGALVVLGDPSLSPPQLEPSLLAPIGDRARPNLKIQDGCNNRCSFCVIPFVRGRSRSASADDIVARTRELSRDFDELVLTGINLGRWGREPGSTMRLAGLLRRMLAETEVKRIRLSSVEPMDWSDELLELVASEPRIAQHVHAPLQSGSDAVLRRMHRKYRPRHYEDRIVKAHQLIPDAAIGADVLTGFPGETGEEFAQTVEFVERLPFSYLHVFPYSERPGTKAVELGGSVPFAVRKERARVLTELSRRKAAAFRARMRGRVLSAVVLQDGLRALTTNYLEVRLPEARVPRRLTEVKLS
jgi:threonylcarbamoyladenosine tRNA methylthiotransferase MtaB